MHRMWQEEVVACWAAVPMPPNMVGVGHWVPSSGVLHGDFLLP